jgi:hypothetical protein
MAQHAGALSLEACASALADLPNASALLRAWQGWRGGDPVPRIDHVVAEDLGASLGHVSILDAYGPDEMVFRLFATAHAALINRDLTGENLVAITPYPQRAIRARRMWNLVTVPCGIVVSIDIAGSGAAKTPMTSLLLPIAPSRPEQPMRLFTSVDTGKRRVDPPHQPAITVPLSWHNRYIDLGFGTP